jgi:hypothetical protein
MEGRWVLKLLAGVAMRKFGTHTLESELISFQSYDCGKKQIHESIQPPGLSYVPGVTQSRTVRTPGNSCHLRHRDSFKYGRVMAVQFIPTGDPVRKLRDPGEMV